MNRKTAEELALNCMEIATECSVEQALPRMAYRIAKVLEECDAEIVRLQDTIREMQARGDMPAGTDAVAQ